jgi:hypothetical protein
LVLGEGKPLYSGQALDDDDDEILFLEKHLKYV